MRVTTVTLALALSTLGAATTPTVTERSTAQLLPLKTVPQAKPLIARASSALPSSSSIPSGCSSSEDTCGIYCIPSSYTCCPDKSGGCAADEDCEMGDNGQYGCCPKGKICSGDGGSQQYSGDGSDLNEDSDSDSSSSTDAAGNVKPALAGVGAGIMGVIALAGL
ncbi:hypothetical protein BDV59DRAFT_167381 [Aspergillus ambiguus]|uniref:uncharacterized protein n=1 Tax=Aspergillus ambiguus TaxID=176160 RepID=UPI003CCCDF4F